jgi:hypothetical protein
MVDHSYDLIYGNGQVRDTGTKFDLEQHYGLVSVGIVNSGPVTRHAVSWDNGILKNKASSVTGTGGGELQRVRAVLRWVQRLPRGGRH